MSVYFDLLYSSEEPEEKKAHTEDMSSAQIIDGDLQANQAAYNYSAWYQVSVRNFFFVVVLYCAFPFLSSVYMRDITLILVCWHITFTFSVQLSESLELWTVLSSTSNMMEKT